MASPNSITGNTELVNAKNNTLRDVVDQWIECRQELTQLNLGLLSLCENEKNLQRLKPRSYSFLLRP